MSPEQQGSSSFPSGGKALWDWPLEIDVCPQCAYVRGADGSHAFCPYHDVLCLRVRVVPE